MAAQLHREVVKQALAQTIVSEARPLVLFFDLDAFRAAIRDLHSAFPKHFLHTLAVKANPTLRYAPLTLLAIHASHLPYTYPQLVLILRLLIHP